MRQFQVMGQYMHLRLRFRAINSRPQPSRRNQPVAVGVGDSALVVRELLLCRQWSPEVGRSGHEQTCKSGRRHADDAEGGTIQHQRLS